MAVPGIRPPTLAGQLGSAGLAPLLGTIEEEGLSGVLRLARGSTRARIDFLEGKPVSARAPGVRRLGELLIAQGLSDPITVREAARLQAEEQGRRQLGEILLSHGVIEPEALARAIALQIEQAITEIEAWGQGRFEFEATTEESSQQLELATWPAATPPPAGTRREVQPATQAADAGRVASAGPDETHSPSAAGSTSHNSALTREPLSIELSSRDGLLREGITRALPPATGQLLVVPPATFSGPDLEIIDLRPLGSRQTRRPFEPPRWPWAAVVDDLSQAVEAYACGALATLPAVPAAIVAALSTWAPLLPLAVAGEVTPKASLELGSTSLPADSATVALGLMQVISELVERAVLFLVGGRKLSAVGAFGTNAADQLLASATQGLVLEIAPDSPLAVPLRSGRTASLAFAALHLPPSVERILGEPKTGQSLLIPVSGSETVVAMLYADNGDLDRWILDLKPLEAAACRFGPSFETELLIGEAARTLG